MNTVRLNDNWDIQLNKDGNIEVATGDYAIAQNCANAVRLFTDDAFYDRTRGIPHFDIELGHSVMASMTVLKNRIKQSCLAVEGVTDCEISLKNDKDNRLESGQVSLATVNGSKIYIEL